MNVAEDQWERIESKFRVWSFGVYYQRSFAEERHPLKRFVKALLASARPIQDREAVLRWYEGRKRKKR